MARHNRGLARRAADAAGRRSWRGLPGRGSSCTRSGSAWLELPVSQSALWPSTRLRPKNKPHASRLHDGHGPPDRSRLAPPAQANAARRSGHEVRQWLADRKEVAGTFEWLGTDDGREAFVPSWYSGAKVRSRASCCARRSFAWRLAPGADARRRGSGGNCAPLPRYFSRCSLKVLHSASLVSVRQISEHPPLAAVIKSLERVIEWSETPIDVVGTADRMSPESVIECDRNTHKEVGQSPNSTMMWSTSRGPSCDVRA